MFPLNLGTCFTLFFDDEVSGMTLDDSLHERVLVTGYDDEACEIRCDAVVLSRRKLNRLDARFGRALTMEGE